MELHQIFYAISVADTGSFTAAAARLHVSQSGVSAQVQKLERELGAALFDRTSRRISVTAEGERLLPALRAAAASVDGVRAAADELRGLVVGAVRLGTVAGLTWPDLFDAIAAVHSAHPGIDLRLVESTSDDLLARVRSGDLDVVVAGWTPGPPDGLESATIVDDALVLAVAEGHPWAARGSVHPGELADADLITLPPGTGARVALEASLARAGLRVAPRWEVASPVALGALAARSLGVAVASESTLADAPELVILRLEDPEARSQLGVAWRARPGSAARAVLQELLPPEPR
ncbi:LysR family transcriptional regulator [Rathayibacter sp. VKM Ac-2803]|uniref:LysR family transcriptional regulator n=1 Tax=Rathayibacter sp. VKM Ac-2803 TaxID=2609256 RepID=UPI00135B81B7|nr:LysR family transcriptional regulator [Rathayibacter sp. VKM Ac-2803]MWV48136.1 LysR family transcriptional regulator [Rathayibacter sp. VKM Ac-2803]